MTYGVSNKHGYYKRYNNNFAHMSVPGVR